MKLLVRLVRCLVMADPEQTREAGFYWISIAGQEPEVAQWQIEWNQWFVTGSEMPLSDEVMALVVVLSDLLPPPARPSPDSDRAQRPGSLGG